MRRLLCAGTTAIALSLPTQPAEAHRLPRSKPLSEQTAEGKVNYLRRQIWHNKTSLKWWHKRRSPHHYDTALRARDMRWHRTSLKIARRNLEPLERALFRSRLLNLPVPAIIRFVFGPYGTQAVAVSYCETGGTFSTTAENGQYLGIFQMGDWERDTYGHGPDALTQSRSAYAYFRASGSDWSPWVCKP